MKYLLIFFWITFNIVFSQKNECFQLSPNPSFYDTIIYLKANICEGKLLYTKNTLKERKRIIFPDSLVVDKTSSFCFFQELNDSLIFLGCNTYFLDFYTNFHILSLTINENDFFGEKYGIYVDGLNCKYDSIKGYKVNCNFSKNWEKKINVEIFNPDSVQIINQKAGVKIFGGMTKFYPEKSLKIIARKEYGKNRFNCNLFNVGEKAYKQLILRHSGNDYRKTRFRDALLTSIISEENIDIQKSTPSHLFVNSEYWGVYNIREKINEHYIKNNYQIKTEDLDILQGNKVPEYGSKSTYVNMIKYIKKNNMRDSIHFQKVSKKMDIRNFVNFWIFQMFVANSDSRGNIRYWRSGLLDNKFRWIVYDTDLGFF